MLYLAIYYHYHQPFYKDNLENRYLFPWVRFHAIKDYYDLAAILDDFPEIKINFNFTPSLLFQLDEYSKGAIDTFWEVALKFPDLLTAEEKSFLLLNFFAANWETMVMPYPRYRELLEKRGKSISSEIIKQKLPKFTTQDFLDLQVWSNLTWFDPYWRENDTFIGSMFKKGRNYTDQEKVRILAKQREICSKVIPKYRELLERGQIDITISPFYHPIIPLLFDFEIAKICSPRINLPGKRISFKDDIMFQISSALNSYKNFFGVSPKGMWPPEGGVSEEFLQLLSELGLKWVATDEEILFKTIKKKDRINLYQPYRFSKMGGGIDIIFRDKELSNLIGFVYYKWDPQDASEDFMKRLKSIYSMTEQKRDCIVSVILDGENCWEYYKNDGLDFLKELYSKLTRNKDWVRTVKISEYLEKNPPKLNLGKIYPGSWINSNFDIWIGHQEDNTGWERLIETKEFLNEYLKKNPHMSNSEEVRRALEELYISEGSDWFWWFGEEHFSSFDETYDYLFRKRLINVYKILGEKPPDSLFFVIKGKMKMGPKLLPIDFIEPQIDGEVSSYFEWRNAGYYEVITKGGTMQKGETILSAFFYGFDMKNLYLRLDINELEEETKFTVKFLRPSEKLVSFVVTKDMKIKEVSIFDTEGLSIPISARKIIEMCIPFDIIGAKVREFIEFLIIVSKKVGEMYYEIERWPYLASVSFQRPSEEFPYLDWSV